MESTYLSSSASSTSSNLDARFESTFGCKIYPKLKPTTTKTEAIIGYKNRLLSDMFDGFNLNNLYASTL